MKVLVVIALLVSAAGQAQSVVDAARKARADKAADQKTDKKAARVYDNDAIRGGSKEGVSSFGAEKTPVVKPAGPSRQEQEKFYRVSFKLLRDQLKSAEAKAALLKDAMKEASPSSVTVKHYYYDAKYIASIQRDIDSNDKARAQLKQKMADLEEELRKKGLPASWADPD